MQEPQGRRTGQAEYFYGTGRRKEAVARVRLYPGTGEFIVNGREARDYFGGRDIYQLTILQPLRLTNENALWAIPQYHIVCTWTLPTRDAEEMAKARAEGRLWDIDTGHDLMISEPRAVADALCEIVTT